ncbi:expressed unknown protein [Ectocarpus siliculosus]|uniref:Uncharacterized protein n=1 Tax=Ectocarpus siliculosus TaxID=2880 RepID=D8LMN0_ECTSI|nr:expressed unknown protein [Ectocarpus siliculosus]|eukprot:CBN79727.1 expressed unknown protein [Ectocarpus siliculosus]
MQFSGEARHASNVNITRANNRIKKISNTPLDKIRWARHAQQERPPPFYYSMGEYA